MRGSPGDGFGNGRRVCAVLLLGLAALLSACGAGGGGGVDDDGGGGSDTYWSGTTPTGTPVFAARFAMDSFGTAMSVVENPDHTFLFAGFRVPSGSPTRIYLVKTDAEGHALWEKEYRSPDNGAALATTVRRTADNGYIVAGYAEYASTDWFYLLKTNANGDNTWSRMYPGALQWQNGFQSVVQTQDGGYVAVGAKDIHPKWIDAWLVKMDSLGNIEGEHHYGGNGPDFAYAVQPTQDGGFVLAGEYDAGGPQGGRIYLVKTDASLNETWSKTYAHGRANAVVQAQDNGYVLTGNVWNADNTTDLFVMKTNAAGDNISSRTFGGSRNDEGRSIAAAKDGGYIVTGSTHSFSSGSDPAPGAWQREDVFLVRLTSNLDTVWQVAKGRAPDSGDNGDAVIETFDNNIVVGGTLGGSPLLVKFDGNGDTAEIGQTDFTFRPTSATGILHMGNAAEAAGAAATAFDIARRIGPFGLDLLVDVLGGAVPGDLCTGGGTYDNTLTSTPPAPGTVYTVNFHGCVANLGSVVTLDGSYAMTFDNVTGDLSGAPYSVDARIRLDNLVITDDVGPKTLTGDLRFRRTATASTAWTDNADSLDPLLLNLASPGRPLQVGPFSVQSVATGTSFTLGPATATVLHGGIGTLQASIDAGTPVSGSSWDAPGSGAVLTKAADNSSVKATVSAGSAVSLDVDTDGDGTVDGTQGTTWDELLY